jgi:hypothetical protein
MGSPTILSPVLFTALLSYREQNNRLCSTHEKTKIYKQKMRWEAAINNRYKWEDNMKINHWEISFEDINCVIFSIRFNGGPLLISTWALCFHRGTTFLENWVTIDCLNKDLSPSYIRLVYLVRCIETGDKLPFPVLLPHLNNNLFKEIGSRGDLCFSSSPPPPPAANRATEYCSEVCDGHMWLDFRFLLIRRHVPASCREQQLCYKFGTLVDHVGRCCIDCPGKGCTILRFDSEGK